MSTRAVVGFLSAAFLLCPAAMRADSDGQVDATLQLRDGRVLHHAKVTSRSGDYVFIRADEGLFQVSEADMGPGGAGAAAPRVVISEAPSGGFVFEKFDPNQEPASPMPEPGAKPAAKPGAANGAGAGPAPKARAVEAVYRGCQIVSFKPREVQGVQGCAEVVIQNATDVSVPLRPGEIACTIEGGSRRAGRAFFADTFPPSVRRREVVPAHGELTTIVTFANEPLAFTAVEWTR